MAYFWENPTAHYPFKIRKTIGPGPPGPNEQRVFKEEQKWACEVDPEEPAGYVYICEGVNENEGKTKTVRVNPHTKKLYNQIYRYWISQGRPAEWTAKQRREIQKRMEV